MYRANPKKLETQLFIIERNPESQLFHDVGPSAEFVDKIPIVSDSIIKTTIDGWNVTTLTRVCCEHHERSVPMILENDRLKVVLHTSTVKHHGKPSLNVCKWTKCIKFSPSNYLLAVIMPKDNTTPQGETTTHESFAPS